MVGFHDCKRRCFEFPTACNAGQSLQKLILSFKGCAYKIILLRMLVILVVIMVVIVLVVIIKPWTLRQA